MMLHFQANIEEIWHKKIKISPRLKSLPMKREFYNVNWTLMKGNPKKIATKGK